MTFFVNTSGFEFMTYDSFKYCQLYTVLKLIMVTSKKKILPKIRYKPILVYIFCVTIYSSIFSFWTKANFHDHKCIVGFCVSRHRYALTPYRKARLQGKNIL